jgi:hypothetical protein
MYGSLTFAGGLAITLLIAFLVARYLHGPLRIQLRELCGSSRPGRVLDGFFECGGDAHAGDIRHAR